MRLATIWYFGVCTCHLIDWGGSLMRKVKNHRVGEVSSKYAYEPEKFEQDIQKDLEKAEKLWQDFKDWMIENKVDPDSCRYMFLRLYEEFLS